MKKSLISLTLLAILLSVAAQAQTLFSYGPHKVSREEFLKAYTKNNAETVPTDKSYREYLDLYIRFKLKVQAALEMKLDTLEAQRFEVRNFRNQIAETYMNDEASMNSLIDEAIVRSRKEINLSHIYISLSSGASAAEIAKARERANVLYARLQKGENFAKLAVEYSEDPEAKNNAGLIGYISSFVLPYDLENIAYSTPVAAVSKPYQSPIGFHIFRNNGERKSPGRLRAAHIVLSFPPEATPAQKQAVKERADSLYQALLNGADFKEMAARFSTDNLTYQTGGELPEFGVGRYDTRFEEAAYALQKDGDLSAPISTSFGYHIIKRIRMVPLQNDPSNPAHRDAIRQQIISSDRSKLTRQVLLKRIYSQTGYAKAPFNAAAFNSLTETVLNGKPAPANGALKNNNTLFSFAGRKITVKDWVNYLESIRNFDAVRANKSPQQLLEQFTETTALEYYKDQLDKFNPAFAAQVKEFREGNLLFEVMQRKIWDAAALDTTGLRKFYESHRTSYWWEPSANALIFTASNDSLAQVAIAALNGSGAKEWMSMIERSGGNLQGDSGRFELGQLPVAERTDFREKLVTAGVKNETDNSVTFCYIIKLYPQREPRNYNDARGFVINDYQNFLEEEWVKQLKKKYPVVIAESVVKALPK